MTIITEEFSLTRNQYFSILLQNMLTGRWWAFVVFFLFSILGIKAGVESALLLFALLSTLFLIYMMAEGWIRSNPKANPLIFQNTSCEIDHELISFHFKDGSLIKIKFSNLKEISLRKEYYLLYPSRYQFLYLPLKALRDANDLERLKVLLRVKAP